MTNTVQVKVVDDVAIIILSVVVMSRHDGELMVSCRCWCWLGDGRKVLASW